MMRLSSLCLVLSVLCVVAGVLCGGDLVADAADRVVARATGPGMSSVSVKDGHRMKSNRLVSATVMLDCGTSQVVDFATPTDCDSGRIKSQKNGKTTIEFANGDHVHLRVKDTKHGRVVKVDHDD